MNEKLQNLIDDLAEDVRPEVQRIEAKLATTQNHYGDYMAVISAVSNGNPQIGKVLGQALIQAGANHQGVQSALRVLGWA